MAANGIVTKNIANNSQLPSAKVERIEVIELLYPSQEMYESVLPIESVFHHMLNEDSVYKFGTMMIAEIVHYLVKADLGFDQFLSNDYEDTDLVAEVTTMIIDSYSNLRGKDFARKHNARHGASHTESTCSKLGAMDELNKAKKDERIKKEDKEVKEGEKRRMGGCCCGETSET